VIALVKPAARGAIWGLIATVAMSTVMLIGQRLGWMKKHPPEILTEEALERADLGQGSPEGVVDTVALASHFAFGTAGGVLYGLLRSVAPTPIPVPMGIAFGLGIWAASYRGWIPAMNILPDEQRPGRRGTLVMIAAHAVYGATVGTLSRRTQATRQLRSGSWRPVT
jgi:Family of unknown function (DUF6789)